VLTAMVTAFDSEDNLDLQRQTKVIEHLFQTGTETIVVAGTTGESPTLTKEEKIQLFEHTVAVAKGKGKVIAGTGSNNTKESILFTQKAEASGVDGIMLVNPYYNRPNQEGLYQHYKAIAESTSLPVMLYNVPGRCAVNMTAETVCRLAQVPNIMMVKEASENLGQMTEIIRNTPDDFILYSGDDNLTLPVLAVGGYGIVSVAAHVVGREMSQMVQLFLEGRVQEASQLHQKLYPKCRALFSAPSPVPVKRVLEHQGIEVGSVRLPLVPLTQNEEEAVLSFFMDKIR
jgi:4-hydroxy-tetrahydrodipicolinate synthase